MADWDEALAIGRALAEVEESTSYNTPALKVRGRLFARLRTEAEGALMVVCEPDEKEALLASGDPAFLTTEHYDGYGAVLVDLERVDSVELAELLTEAWRITAPARLRREFDAS
ncbi:MmcQ/YjbR family DNA-binding protein [Streptomonospora salina]|uniref:MmcQ/YjbR family DNA-binding protein n=1 Tax=Streptomonospora salina TaxID=104205 RepID=A0A841EHM8_9ACTN|nr:MmcQ/YjbR family DNA-binding protein [Streptomonospora salina]MBB6000879.1 hypothetical protein [Streptomonospora salina]